MEIWIDNRSGQPLTEKQEELIRVVIEEAFRFDTDKSSAHGNESQAEVSVSIVENEEIQQLNLQYRGIDKPTDVLSFPMEPEVGPHMEQWLLGDIVISIEKVREQALEYGHPLERELGFLACHGMLHLLDYDHMEPDEAEEMFETQEKILQKIGLGRAT